MRQKLTKDFTRNEFRCKCGCGADWINCWLVHDLQKIRDAIGQRVIVTSGVRCCRHNLAEGGHNHSRHVRGLAADIYVEGMMPEVLMDVIQCVLKGSYGLGVYQNFVHYEYRPLGRRWVGRTWKF